MIKPELFDVTPTRHLADLPHFYPYDSPERYRDNLRSQPADWIWRNKTIRYTLNSLGYRAREFDTVDWSQVIVCFGCSMTFGIGVDDPDAWPVQLSQIVDVPVVNLAIPGGSVQINWANSVRLITAGARPRAVIYHWPDASRSCEFMSDGTVDNWGSWRISANPQPDWRASALGTAWAMNATHYLTMAQLMVQSLVWTCPRLDYTWSSSGPGGVQYRNFKLDQARDLQHPGPLSHLTMAESVARDLKRLEI